MNTTISKNISVKGSIQASEPVVIAGKVTGDVLVADYEVVVETGAQVDGAVTARTIVVRGKSTGRLIARDIVRVLRSASVKADVASPKFALDEGASFSGSVEPARTDAAVIVATYRNNKRDAAPLAG